MIDTSGLVEVYDKPTCKANVKSKHISTIRESGYEERHAARLSLIQELANDV